MPWLLVPTNHQPWYYHTIAHENLTLFYFNLFWHSYIISHWWIHVTIFRRVSLLSAITGANVVYACRGANTQLLFIIELEFQGTEPLRYKIVMHFCVSNWFRMPRSSSRRRWFCSIYSVALSSTPSFYVIYIPDIICCTNSETNRAELWVSLEPLY